MSDEDLRELDLSAWEVPPPPADLADRVIARMREPAGAAAVEPVERASRRWWLGGALAAVVAAAALALVIGRGGAGGGPGYGAVIADRAREVAIGDTRGELDRGAILVWRREGDVLVVAQAGGAATWRTGDGQRLRIDAAEASIDATGASLRVEVPMNMSDGRLIGASALTAAAVALATVVVYEGYVRVSSSGQTVTVQPGATVELRHGEPPAPPPVAPIVGENNDERIRKLEAELEELRQQQRTVPRAPSPAGTVPDALGRTEISEAMQRAKVEIAKCDVQKSGTLKVHVRVNGDGHVATVDVTESPDAAIGACVSTAIEATRFAQTKTGGAFSYPFVFTVPAKSCDEVSCVLNNYEGTCCTKFKKPEPACNSDELRQAGLDHEAQGLHAAALTYFEQAIKCKPDMRVTEYAFMAACNSGNVAKARVYFKQMPPDAEQRFKQMCIRRGITEDQLNGS